MLIQISVGNGRCHKYKRKNPSVTLTDNGYTFLCNKSEYWRYIDSVAGRFQLTCHM